MRPLSGITVVSIEHAIAAPLASRHLAELGARVIKVERVATGDFARAYDDTVLGLSSHFVWVNRSKESIAVDLKSSKGVEVINALVAKADVFIHNMSPGAIERLGLSSETLRRKHPRLIYCAISGYGADSPHAGRKAYDLLVQSEVGLLSITGTPQEQVKVGIPIADISAGLYAYSAILAALHARDRSGEGQTIQVALFDTLCELMGFPLYYTMYGGEPLPRSGAHHAAIAPYGPFEAADGSVMLAVQNDREWVRFAETVLGLPGLRDDPRFATNAARMANRPELHRLIDGRFRHLTLQEVLGRLERADLAYAENRPLEQLADHPELAARDRWVPTMTEAGPIRTLRPPVVMSDVDYRLGPVPGLGEHTDRILAELGLEPAPAASSPPED